MMIFLLLLLSTGPVNLELAGPNPVQVVVDDGIYGHDGNQIYTWDDAGNLLSKIQVSGDVPGVWFVHRVGANFIVSYQNQKGEDVTALIDAQGQTLGSTHPFMPYISVVNGRIFAPSRLNREDYIWRQNFPFLCHELKIEGGELQEAELRFAKIFPSQWEMGLNLKQVWAAQGPDDAFLVMNQLEQRIYMYDNATILKERIEGEHHWSEIPFIQLDLENYKQPPNEYFTSERALTLEKAKVEFSAWRNNQSLITWFGQVGEGYAVAYELPAEVLGIHFLDADLEDDANPFYRVQPNAENRQMVIGVRDAQIWIWDGERTINSLSR
jgi:hypothetical protein